MNGSPRQPTRGSDTPTGAASGSLFTAVDLGQAAADVAVLTALVLIREGDPEAAIESLTEFSIPTEGDEILDAAAVAAQAIRRALEMGVVPR